MTQISNYKDYVNAVNEAKLHDYRYFTLNAPTITDEEYDRLYFAIQDYETSHPEQTLPDSPTQSAHGEVKNGHKQIRRRTEMLSTEKAQTIEKVQKWMTKTTKKTGEALYTVEWKYDGISLSLVYIDGQLTEASYGKGMEGNDCLAHCLKVASIPNTINANGRVEVRGEMVVPFANLAKTGYKNCRSAASGIMADTQSTLTDCLEFHPYWTDANIGNNCRYRVEMLAQRYGFLYDVDLSTLHQFVELNNLEEVIEYATNRRASLPYPTDGLVIKVDKMEQWDSLGRNDHHPHYAIAYKFAAATAETTIKDIQITTGKTGKRTPVAYFEPITINGATYPKASIGSEAKLAELGIAVGSRVIVSLRNDVIPHIDKVVNDNDDHVIETENNQSEQETSVEPVVEEEIIIDNSCSIRDNSCSKKENLCPSVPLTEDDIDDSAPITRYIAPSATERPVTPAQPICAPFIASKPHHRPTPQQGTRRAQISRPIRESRRGSYRMVGEPRIQRNTNGTASIAIEQEKSTPWIAYILAALAVLALVALCFVGLGAAVFFLPLLAGAFK